MHARWRWWLGTSVGLHASMVFLAVASVPTDPAPPVTASPAPATVEIAPWPAAPLPGRTSRPAEVLAPEVYPPAAVPLGGSRATQNVSADQRGERGDGRSAEVGRLLAARADGVNLDPHLMNNLDALQEQRIRSARVRASPQDDRRTPHPDIDPWLASSNGVLLFRAPPEAALPAVGAVVPPAAAVPEGRTPSVSLPSPAVSATAVPESINRPLPPVPWGARSRIAAGVADSVQGRAHRAAGPSAIGRPPLELGHPSTTADMASAHPNDDQDASILAAALTRAYVAASVQDGPVRAQGVGGVGGGGAPGAGGGLGRGGAAHPLGQGEGWLSLTSDDPRYIQYFHQVQRRLDPLWERAFPLEDTLQLRQGTVALAFVIEPNGTITDVRVVRRSGVAAFDANVQTAITGARVPPIPSALGMTSLRVRHSFQFRNPVVR